MVVVYLAFTSGTSLVRLAYLPVILVTELKKKKKKKTRKKDIQVRK